MAIRYSKEMRETAKEKDWFLVQISIDGKYLTKDSAARLQKKVIGNGRVQITGPVNQEQVVSLWRWYERWDKKKRRAAQRKRTVKTAEKVVAEEVKMAQPGTMRIRIRKGAKPCDNCDCAATSHKRRRTPEGWRERQECTTAGCGCRQYEHEDQPQ